MSAGRERRGGRAAARLLWLLFAAGGLWWVVSTGLSRGSRWQQISPGLEYGQVRITASEAQERATLHVLRVDPKRYAVRLIHGEPGSTATAREMVTRNHALVAVNGGFFDERFRPLGLRVARGQVLRPLRKADWGVFVMRGTRPAMMHTRDYRPAGVDEAVQCGPRLVVDGQVTRLKRQSARRTCVGIDGKGRVLLVVSEGAEVDAGHLARALSTPDSAGGLGCRNAMNLDGGPSTQLYASVGRFSLDLSGVWGVPDGLGVFPR